MGIVTVFLIAFGLSMDALAVSVSAGMTSRDLSLRNALKMAGFFGGFQAGMPFVGWGAGLLLQSFIAGIDHWVAYGLLSFVGCKVIVGSYASAPLLDPPLLAKWMDGNRHSNPFETDGI